jgi:hypothetical protein
MVAVSVALLLSLGSAQAAERNDGDRWFGGGDAAAPIRLAQRDLPSDVEQRLGIRPNSANRDDRDDRDRRRFDRDRDRDDDRWDRRDRPRVTVTIPFGAPGYFVRTLPSQTRTVFYDGRRCRIVVTRRVNYRGDIIESERRECPGRPTVVIRSR